MFLGYFAGCARVSVPGRMYPVEEHHLEDILKLLNKGGQGLPTSRSGIEIYELWSLSRVVLTSKLASDWLHNSKQPIKSHVSKLTKL